jgi:hypothetical protein
MPKDEEPDGEANESSVEQLAALSERFNELGSQAGNDRQLLGKLLRDLGDVLKDLGDLVGEGEVAIEPPFPPGFTRCSSACLDWQFVDPPPGAPKGSRWIQCPSTEACNRKGCECHLFSWKAGDANKKDEGTGVIRYIEGVTYHCYCVR